MVRILNRAIRPRFGLSSRANASCLSSRPLTTQEVKIDDHRSGDVHISLYRKHFKYQPGPKKSRFLVTQDPAKIRTQAASLRSSLGQLNASLRRSDKLLGLLAQQHQPRSNDPALQDIHSSLFGQDERVQGISRKEFVNKVRVILGTLPSKKSQIQRLEGSLVLLERQYENSSQDDMKSSKWRKGIEAGSNPRIRNIKQREELQPYGARTSTTFLSPRSFEAIESPEGHFDIQITAKAAIQTPGQPDYRPVTTEQNIERTAQVNIPQTWLRDHCQCSECINPDTKQRQFNIFSFDEPPRIKECSVGESEVQVTWNDDHKSAYSTHWLTEAFDVKKRALERQGYVSPIWWTAETAEQPPEVDFNDVMNPYDNKGLAEWMMKTRRHGFCFVNNTPPTPEATEDLLNRIGPIRNTHYGAFWDFTSNLAHKDTAYTDLALDVHTDTNYFTDSAGLQLFHLLSHEGTGGGSQLVDGFNIATTLHDQDRQAYDSLAKVKMFYHSSGNEGLSIQPHTPSPVLVHDDVTSMLTQIRWNPYDKAAMAVEVGRQPAELEQWYRAATLWDKMTKKDSPGIRYEFQLQPGRPLLFDNWRVLHGRSAFTGKRRMCGGYINRDDFISCFRTTNYKHEHILKHGIY